MDYYKYRTLACELQTLFLKRLFVPFYFLSSQAISNIFLQFLIHLHAISILLTQPGFTCLRCKESRNAAASLRQIICPITDIKDIVNGRSFPIKSVYTSFQTIFFGTFRQKAPQQLSVIFLNFTFFYFHQVHSVLRSRQDTFFAKTTAVLRHKKKCFIATDG